MSNSFKIKLNKVGNEGNSVKFDTGKKRRNFSILILLYIQLISPCEFYFQFLEGNFKKLQDDARKQVSLIEKRLDGEISKKNPLPDAEVGQVS